MRITFLGTGTSHGVPVIGCDCPACASDDPRDVRRRCALFVEAAGRKLLVDTPPDLRDQALRFGVRHVDAVFLTHPHADHVFGFDDVRRFSSMQRARLPVYGSPETMRRMRVVFDYVERASHSFGGVPRVRFVELTDSVDVGGVRVTPLPVPHGPEDAAYGFRFDADGRAIAYVPDCSDLPEAVLDRLAGLDVMILDALRPRPHPTHLCTDQSLALLRRIDAKRSFVVHLAHDLVHRELVERVAPDAEVPYDGLRVAP